MIRSVASVMACAVLLAALGSNCVRAQSPVSPQQKLDALPAGAASVPASVLADADHLYRTGRLDRARDAYKQIIVSDPKSAPAYVGLVRVYLKEKNPVDAYSAAQKAVEFAPALDSAHEALAEVYFRQGKLADAEKELVALVNNQTKEARAYLALSWIYSATSNYNREKVMLNHAHALDPTDADIQKDWMGTLSPAERLKALQAYLAGPTSDDPKQLGNLERVLAMLQDEVGQSAPPCRIARKVGSTETHLEMFLNDTTHIRGYGLRVTLNGVSSRLLLDTGASGILVDRKVAEKAGIKPLVTSQTGGIGDKGGMAGFLGYADSIKVGDLEFQRCYVKVVDQRSVIGDDGLIGADVFSNFLIDIDFPNQKLRLSQLPARPGDPKPGSGQEASSPAGPVFHDRYIAPEMRTFTQVFRFGHYLLVPTKLNDLPPKLFMIDTGAFGNVISPSAAKEVTKVSSDSDIEVKGLSGKVNKVFRADELTIQFGYLRQKNQDVVALDTKSISDSAGIEISGFLGFSMLGLLDIKIDYRDGLVDFQFDKHRIR